MTSSVSYVEQEREGKQVLVRQKVELPPRGPHQALVKVEYVAQNPTDIQTLDSGMFGPGTVLGCDFVGTVEEVGEDVKKLKKGDKVAGLIWGAEIKGLGAYGEYVYADDNISFVLPSRGVKPEEAATIPLASATAWLAMLSTDCLDMPRDGSHPSILVWGGSSSVGQYAIQLASILGYEVITTASPHNHDLVRSLGAKHVFDYKDSRVVDQIKEACPTLQYVFDTIGSQESAGAGARAVRAEGGKVCTTRPGLERPKEMPEHVKLSQVLVWTSFLKDHHYGPMKWPASAEDHKLSTELFDKLPAWLESGQLKSNPVKLMDLGSIEEGFEMYRKGKISSFKIVYKV